MKAVNDPFMDLKYMVYQLMYDCAYNRFGGIIATEGDDGNEFLVVNSAKIQVLHGKEPSKIGW